MFAGSASAAASKQRSAGKLSTRQKGFHRMTDSSRGKFMKAVFGADGSTIDTSTAAALLAATFSGGDPQVGENIAR
jgi:dihydropteroate synthase